MKRFFTPLFKYAAAAVLMPLIALSCMKEGDDCPTTVTARFSYTFNPQNTDLFQQEVQDLFLYVFDRHEQLLTSVFVPAAELEQSNHYSMELPEGEYQFIAFGNLEESSYRLQNTASTRAAALAIIPDENGEINGLLPDLFYGSASFSTQQSDRITVEVPMVKNSKNIKVLLPAHGRTRTIQGTDIAIRITGSNGAIDFENNTVATPATYKPDYSAITRDNILYDLASFKVMKLAIGDDTAIIISKDGEVMQYDNLVELLTDNFPQIQSDLDLMQYSDYEFIYDYHLGWPVLSEIRVGPWSKQIGQQGGI